MKKMVEINRMAVLLILGVSLFTLQSFKKQKNDVKVKWSSYVVHMAGNEADVNFTGTVPPGYRIYSKSMAGKDGPLATTFEFDPSGDYELVGDIKEAGKNTKFYDSQFGFEVSCLEGQVKYTQHIKIKENTDAFIIRCEVSYMLSKGNDMLSPDAEDFEITIQ